MGRNLIPIDSTQYSAGNYLLRISANDYQVQSIPAQLEHKTFSPTSDASKLNQENGNKIYIMILVSGIIFLESDCTRFDKSKIKTLFL